MEDLCDILNIGEQIMPQFTRRIKKKPTTNRFKKVAPTPVLQKTLKKACGSFEQEYQDFIAKLKAKKEAEAAVVETKVEEPVVETAGYFEPIDETPAEEVTVDIAEEPVVETPKKTRKKKAEVVDEAPVHETTTEE